MRVDGSAGLPRLAYLGSAAALAVGLAAGVSGWRYWHDTGAILEGARPLATARLAAASPDLFRIAPEDDHRAHAPYPLEFERQFPLIAVLPASEPVPTLPPVPRSGVIRTAIAEAHRECTPRCGGTIPLAAPLPPRRPDVLRDAPSPDPAAEVESGSTIMSMPALPLLPAGREALRKVADLGTGLTASVGEFLGATR